MHVHVASPDGIAKFWLEPIIALAEYHSIKPHELKTIEEIVKEHRDDFTNEWHKHFSQ